MSTSLQNHWIKEDRNKPILTLFETIRGKVMVRFTDKWVEIEKLNDTITSYTRDMLNETEKEARKLQFIHGMGEFHETMDNFYKTWLFNIGEKTCDCSEWQISGCPCMHAMIVMAYNRQHAHDFVHWYYSKEAFQNAYIGAINPIPDASRLPAADGAPLKPPLRCTLVGRPKKNRRREPDEGPAAGRTFSNKCKKCRTIGHNKKTCTGDGGTQSKKKM
ncbi:hypothetical protein Dsin_000132 [Dipteronia sinensis]|uniref:SWIM-type domain-containing protein n=1 Tax=Dipteronia sinensis TaxID=43782 RepID=A0AAD9Z191_9ROSI|nr:hypothetical protein Dsin_000132 [Dipteronia sinensis]